MTIRDRIEFGLISAFLGAVLGVAFAVAAFGVRVAFGKGHSSGLEPIYFSALYFFVAGCVRGANAAETVVDAFVASLVFVLSVVGLSGGGAVVVDGEMLAWRNSMWWPITFFVGLGLVFWFA